MNKKADGGLTAIVIIIIAVVFIGWLVNLGSRECNSNKDCREDSYCGSDFACHKIPVIEKTVYRQSLVLPILFICITIIIVALIWKWEVIFRKKEEKTEIATSTDEETAEPYYTSQFQHTAK